jgi:flavin-dependent dehydrogenase
MTSPEFDAVVVGGGPAGSTTGHLLAKAGKKVLLLEKEIFPRFHIGESLLPFATPIFERLGVLEHLKAKCQHKFGAFFSEEGKDAGRKVVFADGIARGYPLAFQVKRAEFDELLLEAARGAGVDVRLGWKVARFVEDAGRIDGVEALDPSGESRRFTARVVVDATGRDALGPRARGDVRPEKALRRAALYAHFRQVPRGAEETPGDIRMVVFATGWWWFIPFSDGTWSVGVVTSDALPGSSLEEKFDGMVARTETVRERLRNSSRVSPVMSASDYSYSVARLTGDGYVAVGDAAGFLDPIFSSGVYLALATAEKAADELVRILDRRPEVRAADLRGYEKFARKGFKRFRRFVLGFYQEGFREVFYQHPPLNSLYSSVTSVLAGGVFSRSPRLRFWSRMFLLFADREIRKRGEGALREKEALS